MSNTFYAMFPFLVCGEFPNENPAPSNKKLDYSEKKQKVINAGESCRL